MKKVLVILLSILFLLSCHKKSIQTEITLSQELANKYIEMKKNYSKRNFDLALKQINEIIASRKDFVNAHFMKGKILFFTGNVVEAKLSFKHSLDLNPFHIDSLFWLARISSYKKSDWKDSEKYLERILSVNSDNVRANYNLAQLYMKMNKIPDAIVRFEKALQVEYNLPYIHFHLGVIYKKINMAEKSKKHFDIIQDRYRSNTELIAKIKQLAQPSRGNR